MIAKRLFFTFLYMFSGILYSQVGIGTTNPNSSSVLDISSDEKGILIPRMTEQQKSNISSPANGLMVYQTNNISGFYFYDGNNWNLLSTTTNGDNLGNHLATQSLDLGNQAINNISTLSLTSTNSTVFGFNRFDAGSTINDQMRVTVNGNAIFGILGDGRVNTTSNILMVNNATVDRVDLSEMMGISGSHLGNFRGTIFMDDLSVKEAFQVVENILMSLQNRPTMVDEGNNEDILKTVNVLPKFSAYYSGDTFLDTRKKNIIGFTDIELDTRAGLNKNGYKIPESGTYFIQFSYTLKEIKDEIKGGFISILKNGNEISRAPFLISHKNGMGTVSVFNSYKEGDLVQVSVSLDSEKQITNFDSNTAFFSGFSVK